MPLLRRSAGKRAGARRGGRLWPQAKLREFRVGLGRSARGLAGRCIPVSTKGDGFAGVGDSGDLAGEGPRIAPIVWMALWCVAPFCVVGRAKGGGRLLRGVFRGAWRCGWAVATPGGGLLRSPIPIGVDVIYSAAAAKGRPSCGRPDAFCAQANSEARSLPRTYCSELGCFRRYCVRALFGLQRRLLFKERWLWICRLAC